MSYLNTSLHGLLLRDAVNATTPHRYTCHINLYDRAIGKRLFDEGNKFGIALDAVPRHDQGSNMQARSFQFFDGEGARYHGGAIVYAVAGYVTSIVGLFANSWAINALAVVFLGHAMTIAAYLVHECGHNTVLRNNRDNVTLGRFMSWICGASYGTFEDMRFKHFRHHVDNGDLVWFDYEAWFAQHPMVLKCTQWLEWCYVPAHELIMHGVMVFTSFLIPQRRGQRRRNLFVIVVRGGLYFLLLVLYPKVALMYAIAYISARGGTNMVTGSNRAMAFAIPA